MEILKNKDEKRYKKKLLEKKDDVRKNKDNYRRIKSK